MNLKKASYMIKQTLSSSLFGWEELMKYSGISDAFFFFFSEKADNSALDMTFEATDSMKDTLTEEVAYGALLLILIKVVIESVSKVVWIQRIVIIT